MPRQSKLGVNEVVRSVGVKERRLITKGATDRRRINYGAEHISVIDNMRVRPSLVVAVGLREHTSLS